MLASNFISIALWKELGAESPLDRKRNYFEKKKLELEAEVSDTFHHFKLKLETFSVLRWGVKLLS